eukprot:scaffold101683_cov63-Phaeocystis_antarctica.AAC.4
MAPLSTFTRLFTPLPPSHGLPRGRGPSLGLVIRSIVCFVDRGSQATRSGYAVLVGALHALRDEVAPSVGQVGVARFHAHSDRAVAHGLCWVGRVRVHALGAVGAAGPLV